MLDEGMIIIGKTNLDQFVMVHQQLLHSLVLQEIQYDLERLPGGSSGGSAAAVAADLCTGSLGTETAGSIRLPSSWCGTVGLKPTYGRVSSMVFLQWVHLLIVPGPIVKNVEDAAYVLSIIAGYDENDFTSSKEKVSDYYADLSTESLKGLKVAIPRDIRA
jgi:aspartyl-tRNA(Asn)/glutamyl-tRNA(Gln) amidotransferase subunit A